MKRVVGVALIGLVLLALEPVPAEAGPVRQRQRHQAARIHAGAQDGSLTRAETRALRREQRGIERMRRAALCDERMGRGEARTLMRQQNKARRHIQRLEHNGRFARGD